MTAWLTTLLTFKLVAIPPFGKLLTGKIIGVQKRGRGWGSNIVLIKCWLWPSDSLLVAPVVQNGVWQGPDPQFHISTSNVNTNKPSHRKHREQMETDLCWSLKSFSKTDTWRPGSPSNIPLTLPTILGTTGPPFSVGQVLWHWRCRYEVQVTTITSPRWSYCLGNPQTKSLFTPSNINQ